MDKDAAIVMTDTLTNLASKAADVVQKLSVEYGPQAIDLALEVGRMGAIQVIAIGLFALIILIVALFSSIWCFRRTDGNDGYVISGVIFGGVSTISFMFTCGYLLKIHAWVGMFRPEVYLAYTAIFG